MSTRPSPSTYAPPVTTPSYYNRIFKSSHVLSITDDLVFLLCVLIMIVAAFIAARNSSQEFRAYFLGDRSFHFIPVACSIFMSSLGSLNFVQAAGAASREGLSVYAFELNSVIALLLLGWIFLPVYIASGSVTTLEYLRKRYGGARMELYLSFISITIIIFSKVAVELFSVYRLVQIVYGSVPWFLVCALPLLAAMVISCSGGLKTVITCNTVQGILLIIGVVCMSRYSLKSYDDYDVLRESYFEAWPNTTQIHFGKIDDTYNYTNCGIPKARSWNIFRPYFNLELPWPGMVFGITINSLWYFCCDQDIVQSALGARDIVQAKYAVIICAYGKILTLLFLVLPGIVARILYTDHVACADPDICERICGSRQGCSDMAFPLLFLDVVPQGYRGLVLASLMACGVSSLCASLNCGSTIFTINVYRNFRPVMTEAETVLVTRLSVIALGILGLVAVPVVMASPLLHDYILNITASFAPSILAVFLCGLLWERASEASAFRALLLGLALAVIRLLWRLPYSGEHCGHTSDKPMPQILANFHFLHFSIFVFVLCSAYIAVSGVFSEPINEVHMYRLLYWLRHSKLDRVDLDELDAAYQMVRAEQITTEEESQEQDAATADAHIKAASQVSGSVDSENPPEPVPEEDEDDEVQEAVKTSGDATGAGAQPLYIRWLVDNLRVVCCISEDMSDRLVTKNELRETVKQRADIQESPLRESTLNLHAMLVLLVSAVLWGFLA